ncbi:MAG: hypothetical protein ABIU20_03755, partial [Blastocatellia bacterium]
MKRIYSLGTLAITTSVLAVTLAVSGAQAQKGAGAADFDVQHYKIDAELIPPEQVLRARAEVRLVPLTETRSVVFEMNGSLAVKSIRRVDAPITAGTTTATSEKPAMTRPAARATAAAAKETKPKNNLAKEDSAKDGQEPGGLQFIQDQRENMNVRVDLGTVAPARQPITLIFEYEGVLESPQGGPITNARLAFVGDAGSYLFYAARWFPFHEYAADRSTYEINVKVPKGVLVAGYSERPVVASASV